MPLRMTISVPSRRPRDIGIHRASLFDDVNEDVDGLQLLWNVDVDVPTLITGDLGKLQQCLLNLGENWETTLSWRSHFKICVGVANGLTYLHEELTPRIIHRDIKPANILLDTNLNPKIADFGLAKDFLEEVDMHVTQVICGTRGYVAPEYVPEGIVTNKIDVFSFGILALELVSGRKSFEPRLPPEQAQLRSWALNLQRSGLALTLLDPTLQSDFSELEVLKVIDIALMCVNSNPELRPTMSEVGIMLLEGNEKVFDTLCAAIANEGQNVFSLDRIYNSIGTAVEDDLVSALISERGSQAPRVGTSSTLAPVVEDLPLLFTEDIESDVETPE